MVAIAPPSVALIGLLTPSILPLKSPVSALITVSSVAHGVFAGGLQRLMHVRNEITRPLDAGVNTNQRSIK